MSRGTSADRGAAALEFALVVPVLCVLVFGLIDYGLFFSDSLGARDGVRAAARQASVANFDGVACPAGYSSTGLDPRLNRLACLAVDQTGAFGGNVYVRVQAPEGWQVGSDVLVCVAVVENGVTGLTPMPNNSTVRARIRMRIDQQPSSPVDPSALGEAQRSSATSESDAFWDPWCS
jgi:TadE-like protein